jgi:NADP-reducing hydrogenase subunit HndB
MGRVTMEDLVAIREAGRSRMNLRQGTGRVRITVHMGTCGIAAGARDILIAIMKEIEQRGLEDVIVTNAGCAGRCNQEPMMTVEIKGEPAPVKYVLLTVEKAKKIVDDHVVNGKVAREFAL